MKLTIIHFLIFLLCMLVYQCTHAQQGYVITSRGDSINGEIKPMLYGPEPKVQVRGDGGKQVFSIVQTRKYALDGEVFYPVRTTEGYKFMKLLSTGYVSLYAFQPDKQQTFDGRYLVKADGRSMEVPNLGFKKQMVSFLDDCGGVSEKIESGELTRKNLDEILQQYNQCIAGRTAETLARKPEVKAAKVTPWDELEKSVSEHAEFEGKSTALEMIADVKSRISRGEKIPNYILEGLKSTLASQDALAESLAGALASL